VNSYYAATLLVLAIAAGVVRSSVLARRERQVDSALCDITQKVLHRCEKDYDVALSLLNLVFSVFGGDLGLIQYNPAGKAGLLAIAFSLVCIGIGALTFIIDFDAVEQGVRYGLPERYAWYCAFGLLVGLIFLYWQVLRLLGYLRQ